MAQALPVVFNFSEQRQARAGRQQIGQVFPVEPAGNAAFRCHRSEWLQTSPGRGAESPDKLRPFHAGQHSYLFAGHKLRAVLHLLLRSS